MNSISHWLQASMPAAHWLSHPLPWALAVVSASSMRAWRHVKCPASASVPLRNQKLARSRLTALPCSTLEAIAGFCEAKDLSNLACTCKELNTFATYSQAWQKLCMKRWPKMKGSEECLYDRWYHMYRFCAIKMPKLDIQFSRDHRGWAAGTILGRYMFTGNIITGTQKAHQHTLRSMSCNSEPEVLMQHCKVFLYVTARLGLSYHLRPELAEVQFPCFRRIKEDMLYWATEHHQVISNVVRQQLARMASCIHGFHNESKKHQYLNDGLRHFFNGPLALVDLPFEQSLRQLSEELSEASGFKWYNYSGLWYTVGEAEVYFTKSLQHVEPQHYKLKVESKQRKRRLPITKLACAVLAICLSATR